MLAGSPGRVADYLDAIAQLAPLIAKHRDAFDTERRLPDTVFNALADAGLFRLWLPRAFGGPQLSPTDFMSVVEAASMLDGSIGWLVGNGGGMSRAGGYLPEPVAREFFSDPRAFIVSATAAVGLAHKVEGGYRITGRWPFGSGAHHASHFTALASMKDAGGNEEPPRFYYFRRRDVVIHDTWRVSGLRATGSCDFEVRDLFVAAQHAHDFIGVSATQDGVAYQLPAVSVFAWTVATVPLGIARGAMNAFVELAGRKARQGQVTTMRDRDIVQSNYGRADALHRAARAFLIDAMSQLTAALTEDGPRLIEARAVFRTACTHAAETALRIADLLAAETGTGSIFETSPIERYVRDIQAATKHIAMSTNNYVVSGRVGLGLDPGTFRF
ncbi:acyl-CoA dehydrogenase family protein [Bradyrhizobium diazoefficiens]|uniref:acyl-CoA dehydrogenase family protein n=1 Tax=Bradyrhizobium sp. WYCCWR 12699 TaxID=3064203 RepID=UPI001BA558A7|nr:MULTISPECIES: acyl-CoA dehydrogenase family protein [Bradyrhizobium]MBR0926439.1 acyl-CoA dehydrogenase family protein [Bradyrhizobium diazoefficiens]MDT4743511.1 acyl-CoA dehydrogenase family protein [Bradyrhizobium sp. WYCCWR 12699]